MSATISTNPNSDAREFSIQFIYQCECERIFYFPENQFDVFCKNFNISDKISKLTRHMCAGVMDHLESLDAKIGEHSKNWKLSRMAATDRSVLRLAVWELLEQKTPPKVVLNEAIELAKRYGSEHSGAFVNGILDAFVKEQTAGVSSL